MTRMFNCYTGLPGFTDPLKIFMVWILMAFYFHRKQFPQ